MTLTPGTRVGPYEIVSALGAGGMGEVYLARDQRLDRDVAIKILPSAFAADSDRVARFQREAKILASLNHPHIGGIHGIEEANGIVAIVLEFVDGEDLEQRIARGPIPLDEALAIARQIAEALDAAHEQGIIHRDLKPANIKVRSDDTVKVLDFGLAKAIEPALGAADLSHSPTITTPAFTQAGLILGTAAYTSPEQARGKPLDKRTDVWSFGCVLYEMLTGRRAFAGESVSDVLASVLAREPDLATLPAETPASIRRLTDRCLRKDRHDRLRDVGDARLEIRGALDRTEPAQTFLPVASSDPNQRERLLWIGVVAPLLAAVAGATGYALRPVSPAPEMRLDIATPPSAVPMSVAISPDGRTIAFVATSEGSSKLWLRSLQSGVSRVVTGTDGAESPFWSPDSRSIGFFAADKIKRVEVEGGSVQTLANARSGLGGTWSQDGGILFGSLGNPILRIPATGGEPAALPSPPCRGVTSPPSSCPTDVTFFTTCAGTPRYEESMPGA